METITVGVLLPTSTIRPMSKQFLKAFKKASSAVLEGSGYEFEVIPEMIGTGSPDQIDKALDRFFGFHDVELVTGMATRYGLQHSFDKFQRHQVPLVLCGLGEHYIPTDGFNDHIFINSVHIWQQLWCLGYYVGKNMGSSGVGFSSMYDSGYAFYPSFQQGVIAANPDYMMDFKLMPMTEPGKLAPVAEMFNQVDFADQDMVFCLLCGEEATIFIEEWKKRGLHEKTPLLGLPFLLEAGKADLSGLSLYSTHHQPDEAGEDPTLRNVFTDMGRSTGEALAKAVIDSKGEPDRDTVAAALAASDSSKTFPSGDMPQLTGEMGIVKHTYKAGNELSTEVLERVNQNLNDDEAFNSVKDQASSGWVNPYLAI